MALSLISDLLAFTTLHIYWFYMVAARIFHWQLTILYSLFNLFRGKKRNTLRHRIDSCDYDLDQLLLGTILFTLLTFLFPTIVVYYLTFALVCASSRILCSYSIFSPDQQRTRLTKCIFTHLNSIESSRGHLHAGYYGDDISVPEPLSFIRDHAKNQRSRSPSWWTEA